MHDSGSLYVNMRKTLYELGSRLKISKGDLEITADTHGKEELFYWFSSVKYFGNQSLLEETTSDGWSGRQRQRCQPELISGARAWGWCATGASSYPLDAYKVAAVARDVLLSESARGGMTRC